MEKNLTNENIRKELIQYLEENGIKHKFIAKKIGLSDMMISYFINGKRELSPDRLKILYDLMDK